MHLFSPQKYSNDLTSFSKKTKQENQHPHLSRKTKLLHKKPHPAKTKVNRKNNQFLSLPEPQRLPSPLNPSEPLSTNIFGAY